MKKFWKEFWKEMRRLIGILVLVFLTAMGVFASWNIIKFPWAMVLFIVGFAAISSSLPKIRTKAGFYIFLIGSVLLTESTIKMLLTSLWAGIFILGFPIGIFCLVYFVLAPRDLFFTMVEEGTAKAVMRGGQFRKILAQWREWVLNEEWKLVEGKEYHLFGGLRFFGVSPLDKIHSYPFEWTGFKTDGTSLPHPKETLNYILLKRDVYFAKTEGAEDKDLLPLDISFILTIGIVNPYNALFMVQNWLEAVINRTIPVIRNEVAQGVYADLNTNLGQISVAVHQSLDGSGGLFELFRKEYGVDVQRVEILKIDPPKEQREATLKKYNAKQEAEKMRIEAEGKAKAIQIVYSEIKKFEDLGINIRTLEALEKGSSDGGKWVLGLPSLGEVFSKILPKGGKQ